MKTKRITKPSAFTDQIREAVRASGVSGYRIAKDTGLAQPMLSRFLNGKQWPSEGSINTLAAYLGLTVTAPESRQAQGDDAGQ